MEDQEYINELIESKIAELNVSLDRSKYLAVRASDLLKKSKEAIKKVDILKEEIDFLISRKLNMSFSMSLEKIGMLNREYEKIENKLAELDFNLYNCKELAYEIIQVETNFLYGLCKDKIVE